MRDELGRFKKDIIPWIKGKHHSKETIAKISKSLEGREAWNKGLKGYLSGSKNPNYKNGRAKSTQGYILILTENGYVVEHRNVIKNLIGRPLTSKEDCHHLNEIKTDNRPCNLMAFVSKSAHHRFHHNPDNVKPEEIIFDGRKLHT